MRAPIFRAVARTFGEAGNDAQFQESQDEGSRGVFGWKIDNRMLMPQERVSSVFRVGET